MVGHGRAFTVASSGQALIQPYLAHLWAKRDADIRIEVPDRAKRRARLNRDEAPQPGRSDRPVALVLDNGLIHMGNPTAKPPAERAS